MVYTVYTYLYYYLYIIYMEKIHKPLKAINLNYDTMSRIDALKSRLHLATRTETIRYLLSYYSQKENEELKIIQPYEKRIYKEK